MSRWFRYYDEALNDPKVQRLSGDLFKAWVNLLCLASKSGGELASLHDVAFALRLPEPKAAVVVTQLAVKGLLDKVDGRYFAPHKWTERQFKSDVSNERVSAFRKRKRNVTEALPETPPEQNRAEAERKRDISQAREAENSEAEKPKSPMIRPEAHSISDECYRALGIELQAIPPEWYALAYQIDMMLARGYDPPNIVATFAKLGGQKPLKPMNYFIKAVESSQQNQIKPAGQSNGKTGSVHQAMDRLVDKIAYFDQPAPDSARICGGEGENPIRSISSG